jgi:hypothetical protein
MAGAPNTQHIKHPTSGTTRFSDYKVGDMIRIRGSSHNNGIYTVNQITDDGTNSFMGIGGQTITADDTDDTSVYIDRMETIGDRIIILGNEDGGMCNIWSYNIAIRDISAAGSGLGENTHLRSPFVGTQGWSKNAITTTMTWSDAQKNNDAKFNFLIADGAVRVCDTNPETVSVIKKLAPINRVQFNNNSKGGHHLGYEEHINTLTQPVYGGYVSTAATSSDSFYTGSAAYQLRKSIVPIDSGSDHFFDLAIDGIQFDDTLKVGTTANAALIPIGMVFGLGNDTDNDENTSIGAERFMVRKVDTSSLYFHVYRGYAGSASADITTSSFPNIYRFGSGWNFKVAENSTVDSGSYMSGTWEFAQSFIYDGNQESLLRTSDDIGAANTLATSNDFRALDIDVYAFAPYNGRISGGRIYIRKADTDDEWALLVDIDIVKGCRANMEGEYIAWTDRSGITNGKNGMFSSGTLTSKGLQLDTYATLNGYSHRVDRNCIGFLSENYQASVVAGRRAFVANLRLTNSSSVVEKFGDRIMFSEPNKFDVFPSTNTIDVAKGDAEEYTALEFYADRILAFKQKTLHIINIASPSPSGWFLEDTVEHAGVSFGHSVIKTEYGVCWVNKTGCYLFDGNKIRNLIEGKIKASGTTQYNLAPSWDSFVTGSDYIVRPVLIYVPKSKKLIIQRCPNDGSSSSNQSYIYDFGVNAWVYDTTLFTDSQEYTNPILDWNNTPVFAVDNGFVDDGDIPLGNDAAETTESVSATDTTWGVTYPSALAAGDLIKYGSEEVLITDIDHTAVNTGKVIAVRGWNGTTAAIHADETNATFNSVLFKQIGDASSRGQNSLVQSFVTKDIDFGDPSSVKKVYKIYITFKNDTDCGTASTNKILFALDGNTTFAQSGVSSAQGSGSFSLTGSFPCNITNWDVATYTFSAPVPCQSIALKLLTSAGEAAIWINDISFEYRIIRSKKVV